ncbi:MAG: hypothetical protein ABI451_06585 [Dokdonella sp.]
MTMSRSSKFRHGLLAVLAVAALALAPSAFARGHVGISLGIALPGIGINISNGGYYGRGYYDSGYSSSGYYDDNYYGGYAPVYYAPSYYGSAYYSNYYPRNYHHGYRGSRVTYREHGRYDHRGSHDRSGYGGHGYGGGRDYGSRGGNDHGRSGYGHSTRVSNDRGRQHGGGYYDRGGH